ncbi:MAG: protein translocase SEC61 complex subunit gamma [Nanoarchaeota archaeon]|nr:protein translocase SEC61 complex subunit gamma [Nanoarchaeota archaeon]
MEKGSLADANSTVNSDSAASEKASETKEEVGEVQSATQKQEKAPVTAQQVTAPKKEEKKTEITAKPEVNQQTVRTEQQANKAVQTRKGINFSKKFSQVRRALSVLSPKRIHLMLNHYWSEYRRVLLLTRKPTKQEYKELSIMVAIGTLIVGAIGFAIQLLIQFL